MQVPLLLFGSNGRVCEPIDMGTARDKNGLIKSDSAEG